MDKKGYCVNVTKITEEEKEKYCMLFLWAILKKKVKTEQKMKI